jgi:hypothetical protein
MKLLFTPMSEKYVLGVCDTKTKKIDLIPTPRVVEDHRPFGITWHRGQGSIFITQPTSVWEFDFDLNFKKVIAENLWYGLHQMVSYGGNLWAVSPRINGIQKMDFFGRHKGFFYPATAQSSYELPESFKDKDRLSYHEDVSHYNSILFHKNNLYLTAHNHGTSFIDVFDQNLNKKRTIHGIGVQAHNVLVDDVVWWVDSMGRKAIVSEDGKVIKIGEEGEFIRGLAGTKDYFFTSKFMYSKKREGRKVGDAEITIVQRSSMRIIDKITIKNSGNINDLRIMDVPDLGHNVPPISTQKVAIF